MNESFWSHSSHFVHFGQGGDEFNFHGVDNGATLQKLWVWVGGLQIKAIKAWLSDGRSSQFGEPSGSYSEFIFQDGEYMTSLTLGKRCWNTYFGTNRSREFFACMTEWDLKTEYPIDVGSGICMGIAGNTRADIDCLGFWFINSITSAELIDLIYPTLHQEIPHVTVEEIKSVTYDNDTSLQQEYTIESSKTVRKKSSWSVTNKIEYSFGMEVKAGIPEVLEVSSNYSLTVGNGSSYGLENSEEKTELLSFPMQAPPGKSVTVDITIRRATLDLPYTGTVQITCQNGSVLQFATSGVYKGLAYTKAQAVVREL